MSAARPAPLPTSRSTSLPTAGSTRSATGPRTTSSTAASPAPSSPTPGSPIPPDAALLGWDERWATALAASGAAHDAVARVSRAGRGACDVLPLDDPTTTLHAAWGPALERAVADDPAAVPAAGDWVVLRHEPGSGRTLVDAVLPRRTAVVRAQVAAGSSHVQVLAANADVVAVVEGMAPDVDLARVERLLALAWSSGAQPLVVLTKADLVALPDALVREVAGVAPGADVVAASAVAGVGLEPLRERLAAGATVALLGASGVGKSTLLNALVGSGTMRTRALRQDGKGRHTTVTRELHLVPGGGAVLDTPGIRTIGLAGSEALDDVFAEIEVLAAGCRFADCAHEREPGCAVLAAVEDGDLPERRLRSYRKLLREAEHQAARVDARVRAEAAGRAKAATKAYRRQHVRP